MSGGVDILRLDGAASCFVIGIEDDVASVLYFGARLPQDEDFADFLAARARPLAHASLDVEPKIAVLPDAGDGYPGVPALHLHRDGYDWLTRLRLRDRSVSATRIDLILADPVAEIEIAIGFAMDAASDTVTGTMTVTNAGRGDVDLLACASLVLPVPPAFGDVVATGGRWCREFQIERHALPARAWLAEQRTGRTSHANFPAITLCHDRCDLDHGDALSAQLAWSGNHRILVDRLPDGRRVLQLGALFLPGEIRLAQGESHAAPPASATVTSAGLNGIRRNWHGFARTQVLRRFTVPRKVHVNTWEAVYFDHDQARLRALADAAAALGAERFVLDDGWFRNRRDDRRALGDWTPDPGKYPDGLGPLIAHVRGLGMEFGLWVEPEMVNPDSDLFRAHPDWALHVAGYGMLTGRHQYVLDLGREDVFAYLLATVDSLLASNEIGYLKWDMNRDLTAPGHDGRASVDRQVRALYRLLDEIRLRHPAVEIESCASGGGRADLGILARADRVWASDCNDAIERLSIHRGFSLYLPPEIMGAHVGPAPAHTTGRRLDFGFQASVALFGHFGLELDPTMLEEDDAATLRRWIGHYKRFRPLLHGGVSSEIGCDDPGLVAQAVVSSDGAEALVLCARVATSLHLIPPPLRIGGLDPAARFRIRLIETTGEAARTTRAETAFLRGAPAVLSGAALAASGVQLPGLAPESSALFHLERLGGDA